MIRALSILVAAALASSCVQSTAQPTPTSEVATPATPATASAQPTAPRAVTPTRPVDESAYPWIADWTGPKPALVTLEARFAAPDQFTRVEVAPDSYAQWLRGLPVRTDRVRVLAYDGSSLRRPSAALVFLDVGTRDLQQCADSAIRLHAEYVWHRGLADRAAYHFTSGDLSAWRDWQLGERFKISGSKVKRPRGARRADDHRTYRGWLTHLFRYAGTRSLARDSDPVGTRPFMAGDFFVQPGGPGHAVVILDVAEHADGRQAALIGQGYIPAEDFHVLGTRGGHVMDSVWFHLPPGRGGVMTPSWPRPFARREARRFRTPSP